MENSRGSLATTATLQNVQIPKMNVREKAVRNRQQTDFLNSLLQIQQKRVNSALEMRTVYF